MSHKKTISSFLFAFFILFSLKTIMAQTIITYSPTALSPSAVALNLGVSNLKLGSILTSTVVCATENTYQSTGYIAANSKRDSAMKNGQYYQFDFTPNDKYQVSVTEVSVNNLLRSTNKGPATSMWAYSKDGGLTWTYGKSTAVPTDVCGASTGATNTFSFTASSTSSMVFRLLLYGGTAGSGSRDVRFGSITVKGAVSSAAPTITSFSPTSGNIGTTVTISGTLLNLSPTIKFNGTAVAAGDYTLTSASSVKVKVPSGATTGKISVTTSNGTAISASDFTMSTPSITSFTPSKGTVGTVVTITGKGLTGATDVKFNGVSATSYSVVSSTSIKAVVPQEASTGKIEVVLPHATAQSATNFIMEFPAITSFSPTSGIPGTIVTIKGTVLTGATDVLFNGVSVSGSFTVSSSTTIKAKVPTTTTGKITVVVPTATLTSSTNFVVNQPVITSFTPTHGVPGNNVVISGSFLTGATSVLFNGLASGSFTVAANGNSITVKVPGGVSTGKITVVCPQGSAVSASDFTADTPIQIAEIYGGGGMTGATYKYDYVVLYNPTMADISLNGWSLQYGTTNATAPTAANTFPLNGSIAAKGYYLILGKSNGNNGAELPALPNMTISTMALNEAKGKVALVHSTTTLTGFTSGYIDLVGYGTGTNRYEGTGPAPDASVKASIRRKSTSGTNVFGLPLGNGMDTDDNSADFYTDSTLLANPTVTCPNAPVAKPATNITGWQFVANWDSVPGASTYMLEVSDVSDFSVPLSPIPIGGIDVGKVTSYTVTGIPGGYSHYYRVRAVFSLKSQYYVGVASNVIDLTMPIPTSMLQNLYCGKSFVTLNDIVRCETILKTSKYEFEFTSTVTGSLPFTYVTINSNTDVNLAYVSGLDYHKTYSVRVRGFVNGEWGDYGSSCQISTPISIPATNIQPEYCGKVFTTLDDIVRCETVPLASKYEFEFISTELGSTPFSYVTVNSNTDIALAFVSGLDYNKTYDVSVRGYVNGVWGDYGSGCQITTPSVMSTTKLESAYCGKVFATLNDIVRCEAVPLASKYEFEFTSTDLGSTPFTYVTVNSNTDIVLAYVSGLNYNKTYNIRVHGYLNGTWGDYGSSCQITTPTSIPTTTLQAAYCGQAFTTLDDIIRCETVPLASKYEFEFTSGGAAGTSFTYVTVNANTDIVLADVTGLELGKTYGVRVHGFVNGVWGDYGSVCQLFTSATLLSLSDHLGVQSLMGSSKEKSDQISPDRVKNNALTVSIYPNPANRNGTISLLVQGLNEPSNIRIQLFDISGRFICSKQFVMNDYEPVQFKLDHEELSFGTYFIRILNDDKLIGQNKLILSE